jgi:hypothetical protein
MCYVLWSMYYVGLGLRGLLDRISGLTRFFDGNSPFRLFLGFRGFGLSLCPDAGRAFTF